MNERTKKKTGEIERRDADYVFSIQKKKQKKKQQQRDMFASFLFTVIEAQCANHPHRSPLSLPTTKHF